MYGISQAGMLYNNHITKTLYTCGYIPTSNNPGIWRHQTSTISFTLVVKEFGVKYVVQQHDEHLVADITALY